MLKRPTPNSENFLNTIVFHNFQDRMFEREQSVDYAEGPKAIWNKWSSLFWVCLSIAIFYWARTFGLHRNVTKARKHDKYHPGEVKSASHLGPCIGSHSTSRCPEATSNKQTIDEPMDSDSQSAPSFERSCTPCVTTRRVRQVVSIKCILVF